MIHWFFKGCPVRLGDEIWMYFLVQLLGWAQALLLAHARWLDDGNGLWILYGNCILAATPLGPRRQLGLHAWTFVAERPPRLPMSSRTMRQCVHVRMVGSGNTPFPCTLSCFNSVFAWFDGVQPFFRKTLQFALFLHPDWSQHPTGIQICMSPRVDPFRYQGSENRDIITASIATNAYLVAGRHNLQNDPSSGFSRWCWRGIMDIQRVYLNTYMCVYEFDNY